MPEPVGVLFVEDDRAVRRGSQQALELAGIAVAAFEAAEAVLPRITLGLPCVLVSDVRLPGIDGLELLRRVHAIDPALPVILVTGHGDIAMAVEAMRAGAYEFIEKPFASERLCDVVQRAIETRTLGLEVQSLRRQLQGRETLESLILGRSPAVVRLRAQLAELMDNDADVLLEGETGTGKELVARALHELGPRRQGHFVALNCGGLPEALFEAEIFGHESGAFTGAGRRRIGKLEHAHGGTLFLDEIETMPVALQVKLLRVLEERQFERLGANELVGFEARVIAATKADLVERSAAGQFRSDLYYRLGVVVLRLPALRERREDIPLLFEHFCLQAAARYGREPLLPTREQLHELMARPWPGNVRELRNAAHRHVLNLPAAGSEAVAQAEEPLSFEEQVATFERRLLEEALRLHDGHVTRVSAALGLPRKTLYDKLRRHQLLPEAFRGV